MVQDWRGGACQPEESAAEALLLLLGRDREGGWLLKSVQRLESLFASEVSHFLPDLNTDL